MIRPGLKVTKRVVDKSPLEEGDLRFLDPKRLAAQEKRWRYRPRKPEPAAMKPM